VITDSKTISNGDVDLDIFHNYGEVIYYRTTSKKQLPERIQEADIVLSNKTILNEEVLKGSENLKYIGLFATGYNNVDLEYTDSRGITVCNAGAYSTKAVAQHTFALLLNRYNRISDYHTFVKNGGWIGLDTFCSFAYPMSELAGKTMGIIGFGSIGREVAKIAKAFSMKVLVYTRTPINEDGITFVSKEDLLAGSDIITIHCPLNNQSFQLCNAEFFSRCKKGVYFINTSRGPIVAEQDLFDALESGQLSGAAIDVLDREPMPADCVLLEAKNITITPHIAWGAVETRQRLVNLAASNLEGYLKGKPINVVGKWNKM